MALVAALLGCSDDSDDPNSAAHDGSTVVTREGGGAQSDGAQPDARGPDAPRGLDAAIDAATDASSNPDAADATPDDDAPAMPPPTVLGCDDQHIGVLRVEAWPGGGLQLALAALQPDGTTRSLSGDPQVELLRGDTPLAVSILPRAEMVGLTALLVIPSDDGLEHTSRLEAAQALVQALPEGERIALFVLRDGLPLVAELSERREHVLTRLAAIPVERPAVPLAGSAALVAGKLARVATPWGPLARTLVVLGATLDVTSETGEPSEIPEPDDLDAGSNGQSADSRIFTLRDQVLQAALAAPEQVNTAGWTPRRAGRALAARIAEQRASTTLLGACGPFAAGTALRLRVDDMHCDLLAPAPIEEWRAGTCDQDEAAQDAYPFADPIEIQLSEEELAVHDAYDAAANESDFTAHVVLGGSAPIEATAHFRGQTSLNCARKNYSVNLKGAQARRLAPGIASDEFYLISMCKETDYFRQVMASDMMQALGLFPLDHRYVRLRVGGRERGVYLLLEKPEDTLRADNLALAAVVRRRLEATQKSPDIEYPNDPDPALEARARYETLAATIDEVAPDQLAAALAERFDLDNYLRWLALNSYLLCGDSADEMFFYASREDGAAPDAWYFRMHGWDADDIFKACHHGGSYAIADAAGLLYCAESNMDHAPVVSSTVETRFVDLYEELVVKLFPPDAVAQLLAKIRVDLFAHLQDDAVCAAMSELVEEQPDAAVCTRMREILDVRFAELEALIRANATAQLDTIAAFRAQP